jgi:hypothetical protein
MDQFKIYVNRLKEGQTHLHDETVSPEFLDIHEDALCFQESVRVTGSSYLADDHLITHLDVSAAAFIPCSICNGPVRIPIVIKNLYLSMPLSEIRGAVYNLCDEIRESILLQAPQFAECNEGNCPNRPYLQKFLEKDMDEKKKPASDSVHFPFSEGLSL